MYLAIDPGSDKCGLAVLDGQGRIICQATLKLGEALAKMPGYLSQYKPVGIILGQGTGSKTWREYWQSQSQPVVTVAEKDSTLEARRLYWADHPRRGWRRWLPQSLLTPPRPYDGYAAVVLARRYLAKQVAKKVVKTGRT